MGTNSPWRRNSPIPGTSLDNSVFVNMQTVPDVVGYSAKVGHAAIPEEYADKAVSAVLIKVKDGYSAQQVASNITKTTGIKSLGYVYPGASQPQRNPI